VHQAEKYSILVKCMVVVGDGVQAEISAANLNYATSLK
jgi:hypothetical protein